MATGGRRAAAAGAAGDGTNEYARSIVANMSLAAKIGQMSQIDISQIVSTADDGTIRPDLAQIRHYFGDLAVGSVLNCPNNHGGPQWNASEYREAVRAIRQVTDEYGLPPVIWGLDSVHGANYVRGAIMTPQQINLAATFNATVSYEAGRIASKDTRAAGITWLFSLILGLALQPYWSRVYETFGESPLVASTFGAQLIRGIQDVQEDEDGAVPSRAAACAKHFIGYSMPRTGHDRSPAWIPRRHLYQYFVPPWREAIENAGVLTVMESYSEFDGVPNVANFDSTRKLLRERLGFDGVLVTDYHEIMNLVEWHRIAADGDEAVKLMLRDSSVDMSMIPADAEGFANQVQIAVVGNSGYPRVPEHIAVERVDDSAERVVALKAQLNMFDEVVDEESSLIATVGSGEDREAALDMARQSIVLVKNYDATLPLSRTSNLKVHVTGPTSDSVAYQSGGWTIDWQGRSSDDFFTYGTTVLQAARNVESWAVTHSCGVSILGETCKDGADANPAAIKSADFIFIGVGEESYTEKPGDIRDLRLAEGQIAFVQRVRATATGKIILVYFGGRPRVLQNLPEIADAIFIAFLPGPDGGQAVIDLITGMHNPSGRLPVTYPKYPDGGGSPYFSAVSDQCTKGDGTLPHYENEKCEVQWKFGHGLSYSTYWSNLSLNGNELIYSPGAGGGEATKVNVKATVKNTGTIAESYTALFFGFDETRYVTPEYKRLLHFEKIYLKPGEEEEISWDLTLENFVHIGPHDSTHRVLQEGQQLRIGLGADVDCRETSNDSLCSPPVGWTMEDNRVYDGACHAACQLWDESGCSPFYGFEWDTCYDMCTNISQEHYPINGSHEGWGWNYVACIETIVRANVGDSVADDAASCPKMTTMCRDIFHAKLLNECGNLPLGTRMADAFLDAGVAFVAGIIAAIFTLSLFRKTRAEAEKGDIEFSPLPRTIGENGIRNGNKIV